MTKGEETRAHILREALSLASTIGIEGVTIGKLADHVGMSKSGLFAHFASKDNLAIAILDEAVDRFIAIVVSPALKRPRGEPRVRALVENWIGWAQADFQPGGCIFLSASVELDDRPGPARDRLVASQKDWVQTLATAARIAVQEKHFRKDLDCDQFAIDLVAAAYGQAILGRLFSDPKLDARLRKAFDRILRDARAPS